MKLRRLLFLAFTALPLVSARAQISGFGANGANFSLNKGQTAAGPTVNAAGDTATLTSGAIYQGNSLFTAVTLGSTFNVSFDYRDVGANGSTSTADGFTFTLQTAGKTAVGYDGNQLGYGGGTSTTNNQIARGVITPSVAVGFNVYSSTATGSSTTGLLTGNNVGTLANTTGNGLTGILGTGPLLYSGDVIRVTLAYSGTTLTETLTDITNTQVPSSSFTYTGLNVASILGSSSAFVGFTGSTGGSVSTQTISNFSFSSVPEPSTWAAGGLTLLMGAVGVRRRFASSK